MENINDPRWLLLDDSVKNTICLNTQDRECWYDTMRRLIKETVHSQMDPFERLIDVKMASDGFQSLKTHITNGGKFYTWTLTREEEKEEDDEISPSERLSSLFSPIIVPQTYVFNPFSTPMIQSTLSGYKTPERKPDIRVCPGAPPRKRYL